MRRQITATALIALAIALPAVADESGNPFLDLRQKHEECRAQRAETSLDHEDRREEALAWCYDKGGNTRRELELCARGYVEGCTRGYTDGFIRACMKPLLGETSP